MSKPFSPASERNRAPILAVLRDALAQRRRVLEVGSGTGQHAAFFAQALPWLTWQASDRQENLDGIRAWLDEAKAANAPAPIELDVTQENWPTQRFDAVFSANTLHIMSWPEVQQLFARLPEVMEADASLVVYGPFNIDGRHTSASNAAFDAQLRLRDPAMGLRDLADVDALARAMGLRMQPPVAMPANNLCIHWLRGSARQAA